MAWSSAGSWPWHMTAVGLFFKGSGVQRRPKGIVHADRRHLRPRGAHRCGLRHRGGAHARQHRPGELHGGRGLRRRPDFRLPGLPGPEPGHGGFPPEQGRGASGPGGRRRGPAQPWQLRQPDERIRHRRLFRREPRGRLVLGGRSHRPMEGLPRPQQQSPDAPGPQDRACPRRRPQPLRPLLGPRHGPAAGSPSAKAPGGPGHKPGRRALVRGPSLARAPCPNRKCCPSPSSPG